MRLAKALIRLRVCAGWSEALLVAHTTLLEILCRDSYSLKYENYNGNDIRGVAFQASVQAQDA